MRAYKCDACGELFLLPSKNDEELFDASLNPIPMEIWTYGKTGDNVRMDICRECSEKIRNYMKTLNKEKKINA